MAAGLFDQSYSWRSTVLALRVRGDHERNDPLRPNKRVKLAAPTSKGIHLFVKTKTLRGSLRAFR
jgi:hypothetical protein